MAQAMIETLSRVAGTSCDVTEDFETHAINEYDNSPDVHRLFGGARIGHSQRRVSPRQSGRHVSHHGEFGNASIDAFALCPLW